MNLLPTPKYKYIKDNERAKAALNIINNYKEIEVDTEGTGLDPYKARTTLLQIGIDGFSYVFDMRNDTDKSNIDPMVFKPIMEDEEKLKLLQNANYDMKMIKRQYGYYIKNVYDTMVAEQLLTLGLYSNVAAMYKATSMASLLKRYLNIDVDKEPRKTFQIYNQNYAKYQIEYAAKDVVALSVVKSLQMSKLRQEGLLKCAKLEFDFIEPLCEMELNGVLFDVERQRVILSEMVEKEKVLRSSISRELCKNSDQTLLFNVFDINIDSDVQLLKALNNYGLNIESTSRQVLEKYSDIDIIDKLLEYRIYTKFISTYGEKLISKINPVTGRLHTEFNQMVSTGRLSSNNPNLQNIPKKQKYRTSFIAPEGYSLITCDMSGAELRILGNLSKDPTFVDILNTGKDLHTTSAAAVYGVDYNEVTKPMRGASKAITFGLVYGLSKVGLARRLKITENEAQKLMDRYFSYYPKIKNTLNKLASDAVANKYSTSVIGRRRYYDIPSYDHPDYSRIVNAVRRQGMNSYMQQSNADTVKQSMVFLHDRLSKSGYDAKLILTVHDEVVVEVRNDHVEFVKEIVESSIKDGFNKYFDTIKMETDALVGPCWLKDGCEAKIDGKKCGSTYMNFVENDSVFGKTLVCSKCNNAI